VGLVDFGDVDSPDAEGGTERVAAALSRWDPSIALRLILGGDNAATWHALRALSGGDYSNSVW
jgi:arginase family enzyme